jgi:hypothetical protein
VTEQELRESIVDEEHLKLLSIAYLVSAAWSAFFSLFGLFYAFMGVAMTSFISRIPQTPGQAPPSPEFFGWFFGLFGLGMFTILITIGVLKFITSRRLKQHRSRVFCMIVAGLSCFGVPWGTMLGVFTFLVLGRPSVTRLFEGEARSLPGSQSTV